MKKTALSVSTQTTPPRVITMSMAGFAMPAVVRSHEAVSDMDATAKADRLTAGRKSSVHTRKVA